jgi:hypothetical protein
MMKAKIDRQWAWKPAPQFPGVIVCERTGAWARALRRELDDFAARIVETRSLSECRQELAASSASVVALEFTAATTDATLEFLSRLLSDFPRGQAVVLAGRDRRAWEWLVRELGAVHVVRSPRQMPSVAEIVRRHLDAFPPQPDLAEQILAELSWGD